MNSLADKENTLKRVSTRFSYQPSSSLDALLRRCPNYRKD
jgi:hypothetical protein